ncbi:MAG: hypothetical protein AAGK17_12990, partial [Pseudomonadota bacterium]
MRVTPSLRQWVAALLAVLLPFAVLGEGALAQNNGSSEDTEIIGTITNIAEANWSFGGNQFDIRSNEISIDVTLPPPEIRTLRPTSEGGEPITFIEPICEGSSLSIANVQPNAPATGNSQNPLTTNAEPTTVIRAGQTVFFEIIALAANTDPNAIDTLEIEIVTSSGDRETETIFETGEDTGIFVGQIGTSRIPPAPVQGDCRLSIADGNDITISATLPGGTDILVETDVEVLADPFGVVFDSETGELIDGAIVTLVDAATGQPATVFAEDGVTSWPSTIISGSSITDGAGNVIDLEAGEFWFPLTFLGDYRLEIVPPDPYTAPSVVSPEDLAMLSRPDGRPFVILDASFGDSFTLDSPIPVQVDIPLDRPSLEITLTKTASRQRVVAGDVIFYSITATNADPTRVKRNVVLTDTPAADLRLRPDTFRVNGEEVTDSINIAGDGRSFEIALGDLAGGATARVTYAMTVRPDAAPGQALNDAIVTDSLGRTARANVAVDIERDTIADRLTIIGRVTDGVCSVRDEDRPGIPGVRVMLEDGSFAITDADGRYHFEGVVPGTHVVAVSPMTLPEGSEFIDCTRSTRSAGSAISRFVLGRGGQLVVVDFHAVVPEGSLPTAAPYAETREDGAGALAVNAIATGETLPETDEAPLVAAGVPETTAKAASEGPKQTDWLALGDGPDGFLSPTKDANPRAPAVKVAIRHRKGQTIVLRVDGEPVNPLAFDGTLNATQGKHAVSAWRGVELENERTVLEADIINSFGEISQTITREVFFTTTPTKVELVPELSNLVADGRTRPVVAIRVLDRNDRPLREGIAGNFMLNSPYESAEQLDRQQLGQLTGLGPSSARWVVEGEEGIALIELAPTMVSGSLRLDFLFDDGEITRE